MATLRRVGVCGDSEEGRGMWRLTRVGVCGDSEEGQFCRI